MRIERIMMLKNIAVGVTVLGAVCCLTWGMSAAAEGKPTLGQLTGEAPAVLQTDSESSPEKPSDAVAGAASEDSGSDPLAARSAYVSPDYDNIAKALWLFGAHSVDDVEAVDNYLNITECRLYDRFHGNEFEWKKIREAAREYLTKYKDQFPRRFEYVQPLQLDRYDFSLKGFPIVQGQEFNSATRLQVSGNTAGATKCDSIYLRRLEGFPSVMVLTLQQPFNLTFIRVPEELAKEYIKVLENKKIDTRRERPAYVLFRVRLDQYYGVKDQDALYYADFGGEVEKIEVYADREMMYPLYEQTFE
jgi:hypothetical protein